MTFNRHIPDNLNHEEIFQLFFHWAQNDGYIDSSKPALEVHDYQYHLSMFNTHLRTLNEIAPNIDIPIEYLTYEAFEEYIKQAHKNSMTLRTSGSASSKIDAVLRYFVDQPVHFDIQMNRLQEDLVFIQRLMSQQELQRCLSQLIEDKHIEIVKRGGTTYRLTWDGEYWYETGGYTENLTMDKQLKEVQFAVAETNKIMVRLTWVMAASAIISAFAAAWEIWGGKP